MPRKRYLGWAGPEPVDERDIPYSVSRIVLSDLPSHVDLRPRFSVPAWQQGSQGSCGAQSAAADLLFDQLQNPNPDVMPSRSFIYWTTRYLMGTTDQDSGVYTRELCKAVSQYGWPPESMFPYNPNDYRTKPSQEVIAEAAKRKGARYELVTQTREQMLGCLAQGDPFLLGFMVYSNINDSGVTRSGEIMMPRRGDTAIGGHLVLCMGRREDGRYIIRNSWGEREWGDKGYGSLPGQYAEDRNYASNFWTLHFDEPVVPPSPPIPPVPPVPPVPPPPKPYYSYTVYSDSPIRVTA